MQHLVSSLRRIPIALRVGAAVLLLGAFLWSTSTPPPSAQEPPVSSSTAVPTTSGAARLAGMQATAQPQSTAATARSDLEAHYLQVAQKAVQSSAGPDEGQVYGSWGIKLVDTDKGRVVIVMMPISRTGSNALLVRDTKAAMAKIVNAIFVDDPSIIRTGVVSTYLGADGMELPAISLFVQHAASPSWGMVAADDLERIAQSVYVHPRLLSE